MQLGVVGVALGWSLGTLQFYGKQLRKSYPTENAKPVRDTRHSLV